MIRPLRILVLADTRAFHTVRYVRELRAQGCCVLTASIEDGPLLHVHLKRWGPLWSAHYFLARRSVRAVIERFKPDIVNAHFATGYGWLASRGVSNDGPPIMLHLWGSDVLQVPTKSFLHRAKARRALTAASIVVGDSQYLLDQAREIAPFGRSLVVYWGLERKYLALANTVREMSHPLRVIVPRHHEPIYNNLFVLEALGPMLDAGIISLTVPAWGSLIDSFRSKVSAMGLSSVHYYERLQRDEFMRLFARHDVYLSASGSDSSPASLVESCGLGLVPVCADIPGVRQWIAPDAGYLFYPGDPVGLRQALARVIESTDHCRSMRRDNFDRVKREAVFENNIADTIAAMAAVAGSAR